MVRQVALGLFLAAGICGTIAAIKFFQISAAMSQGAMHKPPPEAVTSTVVKESDWPIEMEAVGTLAPVSGAVLAAEEMGRVDKVFFRPGSNVQIGDILVQLDTRVEGAQLQAAEAQLAMLNATLTRQKALREKNANTQSSLENAQAAYLTGQAEVARWKALIRRKTITAPFKGRTGVRLVNEGEVIQAGREVVALQNLEQVYVNFSLPQKVIAMFPSNHESLASLPSALTGSVKVSFTTNAFPGRIFQAKMQSMDSQVDRSTRNVKLQAIFENEGELLLPGMFVAVTIVFPGSERVLALPEPSILFAPYGDMVYKLDRVSRAGDHAESGTNLAIANPSPVKIGRRRGDMIVITSGLKPGDEVVSSGVFKLRPESQVIVNNSLGPDTNLAPSPADT